MQIPACLQGGSQLALGSKTKGTATPRGASERPAHMPESAVSRYASSASSILNDETGKRERTSPIIFSWRVQVTGSGRDGSPAETPQDLSTLPLLMVRETTTKVSRKENGEEWACFEAGSKGGGVRTETVYLYYNQVGSDPFPFID